MRPAYCTNVVAGRTLAETRRSVVETFGAVRLKLGIAGHLPIGLWLSAHAARQLSDEEGGARALRDELGAAGLSVVTLNGFPYHDFRQAVVKHAVYEPHWADVRRQLHTMLLADLLPDLRSARYRSAGARGSRRRAAVRAWASRARCSSSSRSTWRGWKRAPGYG